MCGLSRQVGGLVRLLRSPMRGLVLGQWMRPASTSKSSAAVWDIGQNVEMTDESLIDLFDRYNQCFYNRDADQLRDLYVDDDQGFVYFDNHPDCDSVALDDHLAKVEGFLSGDQVVELETEVLSTSVSGNAGCLFALVRYVDRAEPPVRMSLFAESNNSVWKIRHLHFSVDPNG